MLLELNLWWTGLSLKFNDGYGFEHVFRLNSNSWACLLRSGLKFIFHCTAHSEIFVRSLLRVTVLVVISCTAENVYISSLCHTLSKALDISRNTPLTSKSLSKEVKISWVIDRSWFMRESPGLNPDYFGDIRLLFKKHFNMLSYAIRSKTLLQIGRRGTRRYFLMFSLSPFLKIGTMFPFFPVIWKDSTF